jgi:hypothetical protein
LSEKNTHNLDLACFDVMMQTLIPIPTSEGQAVRVTIETTKRGWSGFAWMSTDEGYLNRGVELTPCNPNDPADSWLMDVSWSSRDCDGLYDGGHTCRLDFDGVDQYGNAKVAVQDSHHLPTRDHSAERAGY